MALMMFCFFPGFLFLISLSFNFGHSEVVHPRLPPSYPHHQRDWPAKVELCACITPVAAVQHGAHNISPHIYGKMHE